MDKTSLLTACALALLLLASCKELIPGNMDQSGVSDLKYQIINKDGCLSLLNGKPALTHRPTGAENPGWSLVQIKTNLYKIISANGEGSLWLLSDFDGKYFKVISPESGKALTASLSMSNGGLDLEDFSGNDSQKWEIIPVGVSNTCSVWLTSADTSSLLERKPDTGFSDNSESSKYLFIVDDSVAYQQMDGFGASMTESSAFLISTKLSERTRNTLMKDLFDPVNGIGISFLRQPMGSPDFALSHYSYDDMPVGKTDPELKSFSIDRDKKTILPLLQQALKINPLLKIMASPWSPPGWMKSGGIMIGGSLNQSAYPVYANYFVQFIKAYQAEGLPIYAVTPQNEPLLSPPNYAGMIFPAESELNFIKNNLGPAIAANGLSTKIICWDFNWDNTSYASTILSDSNAKAYVAGSAWHYYEGNPEAMTSIHNAYPEKDIWQTEGGNGRWIGNGSFNRMFREGMKQAIRITRNWSKTVVWWNIALNQGNGPMVFANDWNYGLIQIDEENGTIAYPYRSGYYSIAHFSKFVRPGAYRIECPSFPDRVEAVAFKNTDGSKVLVVFNALGEKCPIRVQWQGKAFLYKLPGNSAATFVWNNL